MIVPAFLELRVTCSGESLHGRALMQLVISSQVFNKFHLCAKHFSSNWRYMKNLYPEGFILVGRQKAISAIHNRQ